MKHVLLLIALVFAVEASAAQIETKFIANDAITAAKIATDAVGSSEIAADAVGSSEIAADAVGSSEIAADAVGASELAANAVTAADFRLENNVALRARNAADNADVNLFKLNASDLMEFSFFPITPSSAPTTDYQVANKKFVDDSVAAVAAKTFFRETLTLAGGDITNQYIDSTQNCVIASAHMSVSGVAALVGTDVTLSTVSNKLRITFGVPFATGGVSELVAGDKIQLYCAY